MVWTGSRRQLSAPEARIGASHKEDHVIGFVVCGGNDISPRFQLPPLEVASGSNGVLRGHRKFALGIFYQKAFGQIPAHAI